MAFHGYDSPTVRLLVGPDKIELNAHEDVLNQLPFFRACLNGSFSEAPTKTIELREDDPEGLTGLLNYLYTGRLDPIDKDEPMGVAHTEILRQTKIYIPADKYGAESLANTIVDNMIQHYSKCYMTPVSISILTQADLHKCPLRQYLVEELAAFLVGEPANGYDYDNAEGNEVFRTNFDECIMCFEPCDVRDVLRKCIDLQSSEKKAADRFERCKWHQHKITPACPKRGTKRKRGAQDEH